MPRTPKFHRPPSSVFKKKASSLKNIRKSHSWVKARSRELNKNPLCVVCGELAYVVDHIVPLSRGGSPFNSRNLNSMCEQDHIIKSKVDQFYDIPLEKDIKGDKVPLDKKVGIEMVKYAIEKYKIIKR